MKRYFYTFFTLLLFICLLCPCVAYAENEQIERFKNKECRLYITGVVDPNIDDASVALAIRNCETQENYFIDLLDYNDYCNYIRLPGEGTYEIYKAFPLAENKPNFPVEYVRFMHDGTTSISIKIILGNPSNVTISPKDTFRINELGETFENYSTNIMDVENDYMTFKTSAYLKNKKISTPEKTLEEIVKKPSISKVHNESGSDFYIGGTAENTQIFESGTNFNVNKGESNVLETGNNSYIKNNKKNINIIVMIFLIITAVILTFSFIIYKHKKGEPK